jgi:hypothetical protein
VLYLANPCASPAIRAAMTAGQLGYIDTPRQGNVRHAGVLWCADNGCYGKGWPGYERWYRWLAANADASATCLFATAPDVVANHFATEARSRRWLQRIRDLGYPVAFVAQNYMELSTWDLWDEIDCLFIGGDTAWKLGGEAANLAAVAASLGKWVHMGRVNSEKRYRYAEAIGCDSVDGTYLTFAPDLNLPAVQAWTRTSDQLPLFAC